MEWLIITYVWLLFQQIQTKLILVQAVTRHCDRTPSSVIEFPFNKVEWKSLLNLGYMKLTNVGINQCYLMGERIRERYLTLGSDNFIEKISFQYNNKDYVFHSSNKERTSRSVFSSSMGMFPKEVGPKTQRISLDEKTSMENGDFALPNGTTPIIIHTPEPENDLKLRAYTLCQLVAKRDHDYYLSQEWHSILKKYTSVFQNFTLRKLGFIGDLKNFIPIHTQIKFYQNHNFLYNVTFTQKDKDLIEELAIEMERYYPDMVLGVESSHFVLNEILDNMIKRINNETKTKYIHFGAHDTTILTIFSALNFTQDYEELIIQPDHGSGIFFELHQSDNPNEPEYSFQIHYHDSFNSTKWKQYPLQQSTNSSFSFFESYINTHVQVPDWCEKCQFMGSMVDSGTEYQVVGNGQIVVHQCLKERVEAQTMYNLSSQIFLMILVIFVVCLAIALILCYIFQLKGKFVFEKHHRGKYEFIHSGKSKSSK